MKTLFIMLISVLVALPGVPAWADPGKDESGHGRFERHDPHEEWKRELEYRREAAKAREEYEREAARAREEFEREAYKAWAERGREARKHREKLRREALRRRYETPCRDDIETIIYVPWQDRI